MRGRRTMLATLCFLMIVVGVVILFVLILPPAFWWFLVGCALIFSGFRCAWRR